jgi:hypothetical protein
MPYAVCLVLADKPTTAHGAGVVNNRFDHLDIQLSVSPTGMGSSRGSDRTATTLSPSVSEAAGFRLVRSQKLDTGTPIPASRYELPSQSDELGFWLVRS